MKSLGFLAAIGLVLSTTAPGSAQTSVGAAGLRAVVSACAQSDAACQNATRTYLNLLGSSGLSQAEYNDNVVELVIALASSVDTEQGCQGEQVRLASAISLTAGFSGSADQRTQIENIAEAVANCQEIQTASLAPEEDDGGPGPGGDGSPN